MSHKQRDALLIETKALPARTWPTGTDGMIGSSSLVMSVDPSFGSGRRIMGLMSASWVLAS